MLPWQGQPPPDKRQAKGSDPGTEDEDSEDEDLDRCPPEFQALARTIVPTTSQRTIYSAWDRSRGIGGGAVSSGFDSGGPRVQAALGFLFDGPLGQQDGLSGPSNALNAPSPVLSPRRADSPPPREKPLFRSPSPATPPPRADKGKGRAIEIDLVSSDVEPVTEDEDDSQFKVLEPGRPTKAEKGKARMEVVELSDSEDEVMLLLPALAKRFPSPSPLPEDPEEAALATILSVFPDALPSHVLDLLRAPEYDENPGTVVDGMLGGSYAKVAVGRKRPREEDDEEEVRMDCLDVKQRKTADVQYKKAAIEQLHIDYDLVGSAQIKAAFKSHGLFYTPTYLFLRGEKKGGRIGEPLTKARPLKKLKEGEEVVSPELEREKVWLRERLLKERAANKRAKKEKVQETKDEAAGLLIECGCCFGDFCFVSMVQCPDAHLFCKECAKGNADSQIGLRQYTLPCMAEDCNAQFTQTEAAKFLPETSLALLQKIKQEVEIDHAELEGLEKCPFCPYAYIIEDPYERLFHCARAGCKNTTCRGCKQAPHIPFTCEEVVANEKNKESSVHAIEEAMSRALIRRCPNCSTPFTKTEGCNHITCAKCHSHSCYVCRELIDPKRLTHFGSTLCPMYDGLTDAQRAHQETEAAREAAFAELSARFPNLKEKDIVPLAPHVPRHPPHLPPPQPPRGAYAAVHRALANPRGGYVFHPLRALLDGQAVAGPAPMDDPFPRQQQWAPVGQGAMAGGHGARAGPQRAGQQARARVTVETPGQRRERALRAAEERAREEKRAARERR